MRKYLTLVLLLVASTLSQGCKHKSPVNSPSQRVTLDVFAAASLTESFSEIGRKFEAAHPGVTVTFNFAGSQQLREQLAHGAPADVFASANTKEMNSARSASLVDAKSVRVFARNRLIVIFPKNTLMPIASLADLARKGLHLDVADPAVPVGKYTLQMLDKMNKDPSFGPGFKTRVLANVVSREENVKSVAAKVRLGEADAGVVYVTDVTPDASKEISSLEIPDAFNQVAEYPIAVTAKSPHAQLAGQFTDFVLSPQGQAALHARGFLPAAADSKP
ncbi:MAG TPA: molybdate ABC transporter substrate-binding protein [Tepidisphaeraceae bacterium]|jgi:molybdate transport system substrate-binding protein|nr:molybdate ABC transporter substrate-binding protein [Tepidisphaeraceae bacterium]